MLTNEMRAKLDAEDKIHPLDGPRPNLTAEETAYFDAEHDLTAALQKATKAATKALDSQEVEDLANAIFRFECAYAAVRKYEQTKYAMDAAFRLTDEYQEHVKENE